MFLRYNEVAQEVVEPKLYKRRLYKEVVEEAPIRHTSTVFANTAADIKGSAHAADPYTKY